MKRRHFFATTLAAGGFAFAETGKSIKVGIIGHTGRGNFGHGLDTVWLGIPGAEIVGIADADESGLKKELSKLRVEPEVGFSDYRKMLDETQPEFVSVCPRHVDQHRDMCLASIEAGVRGLYVEKPFLRTPRECDEVIVAAEKAGTKIAVAHRNRYHPVLRVIDQFIEDGKLGKLLEIRGRGKGDRRGGAEDLWVLGTHVLNVVAYFGGKPKTCSAVLLNDGKRVGKPDVLVEGSEGLGALAGNEVHARYVFERGLTATFDSVADDETEGAGFGLFLIGSKGAINIQMDRNPVAHFLPGNPFQPHTDAKAWQPITTSGVGKEETNQKLVSEVQNHTVAIRDLIAAVEKDRNPLCDAREAALTVEMVCAVFESHRLNSEAVEFPLEQRENALTLL